MAFIILFDLHYQPVRHQLLPYTSFIEVFDGEKSWGVGWLRNINFLKYLPQYVFYCHSTGFAFSSMISFNAHINPPFHTVLQFLTSWLP